MVSIYVGFSVSLYRTNILTSMTNTAMNATYNHTNNLPNAPAILGYSSIGISSPWGIFSFINNHFDYKELVEENRECCKSKVKRFNTSVVEHYERRKGVSRKEESQVLGENVD